MKFTAAFLPPVLSTKTLATVEALAKGGAASRIRDGASAVVQLSWTMANKKAPGNIQEAYTLNLKWHTSPSSITYSFPSKRNLPVSRAPTSPLRATKSS